MMGEIPLPVFTIGPLGGILLADPATKEVSNMDERRRYERRPTSEPVEIRDLGAGRMVGLLADISSGGMMLRTDEPLTPGERLRLGFDLSSLAIEPSEVVVDVDVRWCEPDLDPETFVVGVRYRGVSGAVGAILETVRRRLTVSA
jgi:hypothetical protein